MHFDDGTTNGMKTCTTTVTDVVEKSLKGTT